jgi:hypothetical protein
LRRQQAHGAFDQVMLDFYDKADASAATAFMLACYRGGRDWD